MAGEAAAVLEGGLSLTDFAQLLDISPNAYCVLDRDFRVRFANRELLSETGWALEQVIGERPWEVAGEKVAAALGQVSIEALHRVLARGRPEMLTALRFDTPDPDGVLRERYWNVV